MNYYLGLDLGGTNIKAGVVDDQATVLANASVPTQPDGGPEGVIENMAAVGRRVTRDAGLPMEQIAGIGIGAPGPIDFETGVIQSAPNLPGWAMVPLQRRISELTGRPAILENDANAAAFGEFWAGAGRDPAIRHLVMLTLGTGIGSGLIVDGRLIHGSKGLGGEGGHMIVQPGGRKCGCGQRGCLEAYCSAAHTARRAIEAIENGGTSILTEMAGGDLNRITARTVFDAAEKGDALALQVIDDTARYLGIACVSFCRLLDPQMIVFAGGMIAAGDLLFERVRKVFAEHTWRCAADHVRIVPARLGNDAGFIGAAAVAWQRDKGTGPGA